MSFLQFPYREARHGIWGEQTSTLNWCEEDYNITAYCAEFVNSVTNITFIWLGLRGIRDCIRYKHPMIFIVAFIGYIVVGLGSIAFHTTLKYSMQLADELPMIYATCIIGYATFSYAKSRLFSFFVGLILFGLALFITVFYYVTKDPVFHQVSYATLTCLIVFRAMFIMENQLRPALRIRSPEKADAIMRQMWEMCFSGIALFLVGFAIWNLDNIYCVHLRSWRQILLLPWAVLLEGHGWWHLFTGLGGTFKLARVNGELHSIPSFLPLHAFCVPGGDLLTRETAYYFIAWRVWLHRCLDGRENEFVLQWKSPFSSIPRVVPIAEAQQQDVSAKKLA